MLAFEQGVVTVERPFDSTIKKEQTSDFNLRNMIHANYIQLLVAKLNAELIECGYARIKEAKHYLQHTQHAYLSFMYVQPL